MAAVAALGVRSAPEAFARHIVNQSIAPRRSKSANENAGSFPPAPAGTAFL
jgi:hypothetical protein